MKIKLSVLYNIFVKNASVFLPIFSFCALMLLFIFDEETMDSWVQRLIILLSYTLFGGFLGRLWSKKRKIDSISGVRWGINATLLSITLMFSLGMAGEQVIPLTLQLVLTLFLLEGLIYKVKSQNIWLRYLFYFNVPTLILSIALFGSLAFTKRSAYSFGMEESISFILVLLSFLILALLSAFGVAIAESKNN